MGGKKELLGLLSRTRGAQLVGFGSSKSSSSYEEEARGGKKEVAAVAVAFLLFCFAFACARAADEKEIVLFVMAFLSPALLCFFFSLGLVFCFRFVSVAKTRVEAESEVGSLLGGVILPQRAISVVFRTIGLPWRQHIPITQTVLQRLPRSTRTAALRTWDDDEDDDKE